MREPGASTNAGVGRALARSGGQVVGVFGVVAAALALGGLGCDGGGRAEGDASDGQDAAQGSDAPGPAPLGAWTLHEWGTVTSFQGSNGATVAGVVQPEEALPGFVVRADAAPRVASPAWRVQAPAFYVHAETPGRLDVALQVHGGHLLAAWPPPDDGGAPDGDGRLSWTLDVGPAAAAPEALAGPGSLWDPLRDVDATLVTSAGVAERFVYYEAEDAGAGASLPLTVSSQDSETIEATNVEGASTAGGGIPMAWYVWVHEGGGLIASLGPIETRRTFSRLPTPKETNVDIFALNARGTMEADLARLGLRADEAHALVDAWDQSVFRTHGRRLIYVLPPAWAEARVGLTLTPPPASHVRVWLGRVEFLLPTDESALLDDLRTRSRAGEAAIAVRAALGPFAVAKLQRASALLAPEDPLQPWLLGLLTPR